MKKMSIIGLGEAGLALVPNILSKKTGVSLDIYTPPVSDRIGSMMFMSSDTVEIWKEKLGLPFDNSQPIDRICVEVRVGGSCLTSFSGTLSKPAYAVDQRWRFEAARDLLKKDPRVIFHDRKVNLVTDIGEISKHSDITVVSTGAGDNSLFPLDVERPHFNEPKRKLALVYLAPRREYLPSKVFVYVFAGLGEIVIQPCLALQNGVLISTYSVLVEALPGTELDVFKDLSTDQAEGKINEILERFGINIDGVNSHTILDDNCFITGSRTQRFNQGFNGNYTSPIVCVGDARNPKDPLCATGSNQAIHEGFLFADVLIEMLEVDSLKSQEEIFRRFDKSFYEEYSKHSNAFTALMLEPPSENMIGFLIQCQQSSVLANKFVRCFENPRTSEFLRDQAELIRILNRSDSQLNPLVDSQIEFLASL